MPYRKWAIEPVFLSRKPLPPDKHCNGQEFLAVTNSSLVHCLQQLSSVAKIADRIFDEIGSEFRLVAERADRLKLKVEVCQNAVDKLNARAVQVPVSDLCETSRHLRRHKPYTTRTDPQTQFFLPSTRPPCIDEMYNKACATPVAVICSIDRYRTDGLTSSQLFMVTPVLGGTRKKRRKHLDIETRKPANFTLAREQDDETFDWSSFSAAVSPSLGGNLRQNASRELERLPSPEEQALCVSLEYPSTVVPVDTSGSTFSRLSMFRRSLIHADFIIKRKKDKRKSKRRHTVCEGDSREIEKAIRDISVAHSSCQTDDTYDIISSTSTTIHRSLSKRRSRSTMDNSRRKSSDLDLDSLKQDSKASEENIKDPSKKSKLSAIKSRACSFNPLSSISAAITMAAVKMRQSSRITGKQDDGRSSSGNWSASSSTRASVDSDHHHAVTPVDGISSPSRNSIGKDSLLSDIAHQDQHNRSRDDIPVQQLTKSPSKQKKYTPINPPWAFDPGSSNTPTPDPTAHDSTAIRSPYAGRKGTVDDGDSSVYSVDTDGYYTSMHTDSGLWSNAFGNPQKPEELNGEGYRLRQESQSSVSTIGNSSINSFLSNKSATECSSSSSSSLKRRSVIPQPPPRISSCPKGSEEVQPSSQKQEGSASDKSDSPQPHTGSASESDFDVGDRIRVKTAITPYRYPSMCAVSPETSDDEIGDWKNTANVVVAEVHREEKEREVRHSSTQPKVPNDQRLSERGINMYRSETPVQSCFSSKINQGNQVTTSTPRSGITITTFAPDLQDFSDTSTNKTGSSEDLKSIDDGLIVTEQPVSPLTITSMSEKSLIPLKYAQRITVTPIARSGTSSNSSGVNSSKLSSIQPGSSDLSSSSLERKSSSKSNSLSSYVSYKSPDSPVSSPTYLFKHFNSVPNSPTGSLLRPVARVTLDPTGKVVFSSNSLERNNSNNNNECTNNTSKREYNTLPIYQSPFLENRKTSKIPLLKQNASDSKNISNEPNNGYSGTPEPNSTTPVSSKRVDVTSGMNRTTTPITFNRVGGNSVINRAATPTEQNRVGGNSVMNRAATPTELTKVGRNPVVNRAATPTEPSRVGGNSVMNRAAIPVQQNRLFANSMMNRAAAPIAQNRLDGNSVMNRAATPTELNRVGKSPIINPTVTPPMKNVVGTSLDLNAASMPENQNQNSPTFVSPTAGRDFNFRPSRGGRLCRSYFPSHMISQTNQESVRELSNHNTNSPSSTCHTEPNKSTNTAFTTSNSFYRPTQYSPMPTYTTPNVPSHYNNSSQNHNINSSTNVVPNKNLMFNSNYRKQNSEISNSAYLPSRDGNSKMNNNLYPQTNIKDANLYTSNVPSKFTSKPPDLIPSGASPPSTLDITCNSKSSVSQGGNTSSENELKSLSANELFAIIHSSKKKHNIKTESEKSMSPLSSRSTSPALSQCSLPSKLQPVETGILCKRSNRPVDKTNWYNSVPSNLGRRPLTIQEKIGNVKPTSMRDFKMLLLQARTGGQDSSPRPSAAELLKVSPPKTSTCPSSTRSPVSPVKSPGIYLNQNSFSPSIVPVKRNRARSPYLARYDSAYPPIMEDCSEEVESNYDSKCLGSQSQTAQYQEHRNLTSVRGGAPVAKATSTWV